MHNISDIVIKINCNFFLSAWLENILHQDLVLKPIYIFVRGEHKKNQLFFLQEQINQTKRDVEIKIQIDISFVLSS